MTAVRSPSVGHIRAAECLWSGRIGTSDGDRKNPNPILPIVMEASDIKITGVIKDLFFELTYHTFGANVALSYGYWLCVSLDITLIRHRGTE